MANKNNIRSIRISDDILELIEQQAGNNFTEKWENLVTRCVWELPQKEKDLEYIEYRIQQKRAQFTAMSERMRKMEACLEDLTAKFRYLQVTMNKAIETWEP